MIYKLKESGKDLYGFLFNDCLLIVEANESLHAEIFKPTRYGKIQQLQIYKSPMLLDSISAIQTKSSQSAPDCVFQILADKEYCFKTSNPSLKYII